MNDVLPLDALRPGDFGAALAALDRHRIDYRMRRGAEEPAGCLHRALELLVAPANLRALTSALETEGYVRLPPEEVSPHRCFAAYDDRTGAWAVLRVLPEFRFWRNPLATTWRRLSARSRHLLSPLCLSPRRRGRALVLLGPDGAGKSTLALMLERESPLRARRIYMGIKQASSRAPSLVGRGHGEGGGSSGRLPWKAFGFAKRLARQWSRHAAAHYHLRRGRLVVFDRYRYDAVVTGEGTTLRARVRRRLLSAGAPSPDLVVVLDAPGDVLWQRKQEHTPELLERRRRAYLELCNRLPRCVAVDATQEVEVVRRAVLSLIWSRYSTGREG